MRPCSCRSWPLAALGWYWSELPDLCILGLLSGVYVSSCVVPSNGRKLGAAQELRGWNAGAGEAKGRHGQDLGTVWDQGHGPCPLCLLVQGMLGLTFLLALHIRGDSKRWTIDWGYRLHRDHVDSRVEVFPQLWVLNIYLQGRFLVFVLFNRGISIFSLSFFLYFFSWMSFCVSSVIWIAVPGADTHFNLFKHCCRPP